jgi:ADP-ribose pyrophosphatase YjhB (NUDIX family)
MPLAPKYCNQCGHTIEVREVEGKMREVCSDCGMVFYRNPLPVAAAIVLNPNREVLLVKRKNEPRKGLWCLPMGFAELDESIAQACLRELEEETGVKGTIARLIAVRSTTIEPYGDLLVVTFEAEKTGGVETPGDDASEVAYFPMDNLPPLAFEPTEYDIRYCAKIHREEWAIQDSFTHMQKEHTTQGLLSDVLVAFIKDHAEEISELWLHEVRYNPTTPTYGKREPEALLKHASNAISQFSSWLSGSEADEKVKDFYITLGIDRKSNGFGLNEVISSLSLLRKHILTFALNKGVWKSAIDAYTVLELDWRIILFFDKAIYYTARGFADNYR